MKYLKHNERRMRELNAAWESFSHFTKCNINLNSIIIRYNGKTFKNNVVLQHCYPPSFIECALLGQVLCYIFTSDLYSSLPYSMEYIYIYICICICIVHMCKHMPMYVYVCTSVKNWNSDYLPFFLKFVPTAVWPKEPHSCSTSPWLL